MVASKTAPGRKSQSWLAAMGILIVVGCGCAIAGAKAAEVDKPLVIGQAPVADSKGEKSGPADSAKPDANSETKSEANVDAKPEAKPAKPTVGSPEERAATALSFVREHHPELVDLLERLKASNVLEYERAIRDLARTSDRLAGLRAKSPERYALELESWKVKSQIQLLAARASLSNNVDLASELRELIERQLEHRSSMLELERSELTERLDRVEVALEAADANRQTQLDKQLNEVLRGIDEARAREADRKAKKPAARGKGKRDNKKESKKEPKQADKRSEDK